MNENWMAKAAWYELLSMCFLNPSRESMGAFASGEAVEAVCEIGEFVGLEQPMLDDASNLLARYQGSDVEEIFHELRREQTRLFVGAGDPVVTPYAGVWSAQRQGKRPLLMVGSESIAIERFMVERGVSRPKGTGGPVDHIGSLLEFLSVLCLACADSEATGADLEDRAADYAFFYERHFIRFARHLAVEIDGQTTSDLLTFGARALLAMPESAF